MKIVTILNIFVKVLFTSCICVDYLLIFCVDNFMFDLNWFDLKLLHIIHL